ncbi:LLM class flavin-dependent oxidoreductase [Nonomuraea sp. NPDC046570]|uniref:LLM class flavin-dependent oxidoreductase n=1 Tax=Nonomuraea sp. NPDC046570 TaxID=3155255 RepID=UPI0033C48A17
MYTTFGLSIPASAGPHDDPVAEAVRAERLGFDFVSTSDHPCGTDPTFETWTLLTWIAAATSRISIATRVLGVPYRPPAMVAKMAESLHRLSGGRLILGLGGGYSDAEFRAFGLPVPSAREKVDGLEEAVRIARGLWSQRSFTFQGELYQVEAADLEPKPVRPIPIWMGTFGPRALELTGRLADGWIPSLGFAPPERAAGMRERVLASAEAAGRDPAELTCAYHLRVYVGEGHDLGPGGVAGPPEAVAERLAGFARLGFRTLSLAPEDPEGPEGADARTRQAERLAGEVIPLVRAMLS